MTARCIAAALVMLAQVASAAPGVTVTWSAPAECPAREHVIARIERELGGPTAVHGVEASLAVVHDDAYRLHLAIRHSSAKLGERDLAGKTCDEVIEAAALIVALAIHKEAEAAAAQPAVIDTTEPVPAPETPMTWTAGAGLGGEAGGLPGVGPGIGVALAALRPPYRVELAAMFWFGRRATLASSAEGGDLDLLAGTLRGCYGERVGGCAGIELGGLHASGVGTTTTMTHWTSWLAPSAGVVGRWPVAERIWIVAHADLAIPLTRPHFVIDGNQTDVFQPAAVVGRGSVALEARFR